MEPGAGGNIQPMQKAAKPSKSGAFPVWLIVVLVLVFCGVPVLGILAAIAIPSYHDYTVKAKMAEVVSDEAKAEQEAEAKANNVPSEYKSALNQATSYANKMHMSKRGVYNQLISEYGGKFTAAAAQYAIDNVKADWDANPLAQAKIYQGTMYLSPAAVRDQLVSEYGGKFTATEADYAIQHLND